MGITPSQPVAVAPGVAASASSSASLSEGPAAPPTALPPSLLEELWQQSGASAYGLSREECEPILQNAGLDQNYGQPANVHCSAEQIAAFFAALKLADLVLAHACAAGHEHAWEHFFTLHRQPLTRAAICIARSETVGRELADALYAELYGLTLRDGQRRSPLSSYRGRGSLLGWLRTILAQRFVDHHRRTGREEPLENESGPIDLPAPASDPAAQVEELDVLGKALQTAIAARSAEDRFLLASYYFDRRTLLQIGVLLRVHEATVSRKLRRLLDDLRKQLLHQLQSQGLSKRAALETLGADPRDLELNLRKLLQPSPPEAFPEGGEA